MLKRVLGQILPKKTIFGSNPTHRRPWISWPMQIVSPWPWTFSKIYIFFLSGDTKINLVWGPKYIFIYIYIFGGPKQNMVGIQTKNRRVVQKNYFLRGSKKFSFGVQNIYIYSFLGGPKKNFIWGQTFFWAGWVVKVFFFGQK